jgi:hypothetical protein
MAQECSMVGLDRAKSVLPLVGWGLSVAFAPPDLARHVGDRLLPWPPADDPWTTLRWCNGRMALPDHERLTDWSWHPAPLSEWDGTRRRRER